MLSPLNLAFMGDGIYGVMVREHLIGQGNVPVSELHRQSVDWVCCKTQSQVYRLLWPLLSERELQVMKRGRNAATGHLPKNADPAQYHQATGVEALFGFLYLNGELERMKELFAHILSWKRQTDPQNSR